LSKSYQQILHTCYNRWSLQQSHSYMQQRDC